MIYLILGMHKSGTTLVAQTLHQSGICMGDDLTESDLDYRSEKTEARTARLINSKMLQSEGKYSLELESLAVPSLDADAEALLISFVELHERKYTKWGFKDPRTVLTYELWRQQLPEHKLILVYRPLDQVWRHYTRDRLKGIKAFSFKTFRKGLRAIQAWVVYNEKLLKSLEHKDTPSILINYDQMMGDPSILEELGHFTQTELVDCRRDVAASLSGFEQCIFNMHQFVYRLRNFGGSLGRLKRALQKATVGIPSTASGD